MPRRHILTERQRKALFDLPTDEGALLRHYILDDDDIEHIRTRRHAHNKLGFALQLCAFRYPGRLLTAGEVIPLPVTEFLAAQIGVKPHELAGYAETNVTRRRHLIDLRSIYGYKMFSGRGARDLKTWLDREAETAHSNEDLVKRFIGECRRAHTILPGISIIERLCADALVAAERRIETRIVDHLNDAMKDKLDALLTEHVDGRISRFIWLRQFEVGKNTADINRLLDKLEFLQGFEFPVDVLDGIPPHPTALRACVVRMSAISQMVCGIFPVTGGWLFLRFALWNGALPLLMPWWKLTTVLSKKFGGMRRSFATHRSMTPRHLCRIPCVLSKTWTRHYSKRKGMMHH